MNHNATFTLPNPTLHNPVFDSLGRPKLQIRFEVSFAILVCLGALTGNMLVVFAIHYNQRLKTITNMLVENLAFTDIFMASLHIPFWVISLRYGRWIFGHLLCQLAGLTQLIFGITSLYTMTGIALNRYLNIVKRNLYLKYFSTKKATYIMIFAAWFVPLAITTPQLYGWGKIEYHVLFADCTCVSNQPDISFNIFLWAGSVLPTAVIICFCYYTIYKTVRASAQRVQGHADSTLNVNGNTLSNNTDVTENKILKTSFVVVCVYMLCWIPVSVMTFIEFFGSSSPRWAYISAYFFMYSTSLTNPFIYGIMNPQFQQAFKRMLWIGRNDLHPISTVIRIRGSPNGTKDTALDGLKWVEDMPSSSIQPLSINQKQNPVNAKAKNKSGASVQT